MARIRQMYCGHGDHPIFGGACPISEHSWLTCTGDGAILNRSRDADQVLAQVGQPLVSRKI
jgi:hypothetical protein